MTPNCPRIRPRKTGNLRQLLGARSSSFERQKQFEHVWHLAEPPPARKEDARVAMIRNRPFHLHVAGTCRRT
eukprot:15420473-Alexandrium_andersonii.AAC.1